MSNETDAVVVEERRGNWFLSLKGNQLFPFDLRPEDIDIEEVAHSLSHLCRFNGHCKSFYSVAQHSVLTASVCPSQYTLIGLLHDATEAYCGDLIRPIKRAIPEFENLEAGIWSAIAGRFGLPLAMPEAVKEADTRMLQTERRDLLAPHQWKWMEDQIADNSVMPYEFTIKPWPQEVAKLQFLSTFDAVFNRLGVAR